MRHLGRGLGLALVATALVFLAWFGLQPGDTGPPLASPTPVPAALSEEPVREASEDAVVQGSPASNLNEAVGAGDGADDEGFYPDERRAKRLEAGIHLLLGSVAPELDLTLVEGACADDGRRCTFSGPWPGDDFLGRWVEATADGRISSENLRGVVIERFEPVELETGETVFEIAATLKRPNRR
jgi:hypothetical protein